MSLGCHVNNRENPKSNRKGKVYSFDHMALKTFSQPM